MSRAGSGRGRVGWFLAGVVTGYGLMVLVLHKKGWSIASPWDHEPYSMREFWQQRSQRTWAPSRSAVPPKVNIIATRRSPDGPWEPWSAD